MNTSARWPSRAVHSRFQTEMGHSQRKRNNSQAVAAVDQTCQLRFADQIEIAVEDHGAIRLEDGAQDAAFFSSDVPAWLSHAGKTPTDRPRGAATTGRRARNRNGRSRLIPGLRTCIISASSRISSGNGEHPDPAVMGLMLAMANRRPIRCPAQRQTPSPQDLDAKQGFFTWRIRVMSWGSDWKNGSPSYVARLLLFFLGTRDVIEAGHEEIVFPSFVGHAFHVVRRG